MSLLLILIFMSGMTHSRKVASDEKLIKEGKEVLVGYMNCRASEEKEFLACTNRHLSSDIPERKKRKLAAWVLMGFRVSSIDMCQKAADQFFSYDESYELQLCFDVTHKGMNKRGTAFFKRDEADLKILHFQY